VRLSGVWYFDSRPVPASDEAWVRAGVGGPGGRDGQLLGGPGLWMGHGPSLSARDSTGFAAGPDGSVCSWDGRLDNREDLLHRSGCPREAGNLEGTLALWLYRTRGTAGLRDLVGDWRLVIADASRQVLLSGDYAGVRPLYYCRTDGCLRWSSSLSHLVRWTGRDQLDEKYVASFLKRGSAPHLTPYSGIFPVPPGRVICVSPETVLIRTSWNLPVDQEIRFQDPAGYQEQLRTLFREAVAVRLPPCGPACAELSGGLDSSSIVGMADSIATSGHEGLERPVTFTYTHEGAPDEKYVKIVERARGMSSIRLDLEAYPYVAADDPGDGSPAWWGPRLQELKRRLAAIGSGVFLTGQLGDFIMGNMLDDSEQAVDHLLQGRLRDALGEVYAWSHALQVPIYPLLWRTVRTAYSPWTAPVEALAADYSPGHDAPDHYLTAKLRRISMDRDAAVPEHSWRAASPAKRSRFRGLAGVLDSRSLQTPEAFVDISYSHPYTHRPLVEFMLSIPAGEVCRPGEPRRLMRRSFSDLLPPAVLRRKSKAAYTGVYRTALVPLASAMLAHPNEIRSVVRGYVDRQSVTERLERFVQGLECNEPQLRQLLLFEFWLRKREASSNLPVLPTAATLSDRTERVQPSTPDVLV